MVNTNGCEYTYRYCACIILRLAPCTSTANKLQLRLKRRIFIHAINSTAIKFNHRCYGMDNSGSQNETEMSCWQKSRHSLCRKLSIWKLPVHPLTKMSWIWRLITLTHTHTNIYIYIYAICKRLNKRMWLMFHKNHERFILAPVSVKQSHLYGSLGGT